MCLGYSYDILLSPEGTEECYSLGCLCNYSCHYVNVEKGVTLNVCVCVCVCVFGWSGGGGGNEIEFASSLNLKVGS